MTDKFDPATHVFGMAYKHIEDGEVVFPVSIPDVFNEVNIVAGGELRPSMVAIEEFTRAPEHDLIPKAKADKLAEALRRAKQMSPNYEFLDSGDVPDTDEKYDAMQRDFELDEEFKSFEKQADEALKNYEEAK